MPIRYQITIPEDSATPVLAVLIAGLEDKSELNAYVGREVSEFTVAHLAKLGTTRHATANRLGATPTGFMRRASESVSYDADREAAFIDIAAPGFSQAFGDLTITPGAGKKFLTIPVHADAYGKRARDIGGETFIVSLGGDNAALPARPGSEPSETSGGENPRQTLVIAREGAEADSLEVLYVLVKRVRKKQDRTLLPSDDAIGSASELGALAYLDEVEARAAQNGGVA